MWTVFDHPLDHPTVFIARRGEVTAGQYVPTLDVIVSHDIEKIREQLQDMGLFCLPRQPNDDPKIVEVWL